MSTTTEQARADEYAALDIEDRPALRLTFTTQRVDYHGWSIERGDAVAIDPLVLGPLTAFDHVTGVHLSSGRSVGIPVAALPVSDVVR